MKQVLDTLPYASTEDYYVNKGVKKGNMRFGQFFLSRDIVSFSADNTR
jgi:hypothetical protein